MEPLIAYKIFDSIRLLTRAMDMLRELCIDGITANETRCRELMENSIGLITALNPYIGYENATRIAKVALESGRGVLELVREEQLLDEATPAGEQGIADRLTADERRLWRLVAEGVSTVEIATTLHVSERTTKRLVAHLLRRLDVTTRVEAAALAGRVGLDKGPGHTRAAGG